MDKVFQKIEDEINNKNEYKRAQVVENEWRNDKFSKIKNGLNRFDLNSS